MSQSPASRFQSLGSSALGRLQSLSGLARTLNPSVPGNRWVLILAGTALLAWLGAGVLGGVAGEPWLARLGQALGAALAVLLAWALARELDPDREAAAVTAAVLALAALAVASAAPTFAAAAPVATPPGVAEPLLVLLAMRVLTRTSGAGATLWDALVVLGLGLWVGLGWLGSAGAWVYPLVAGAALALDGALPPRVSARVELGAVGLAALLGFLVLLEGVPAVRLAGPLPVLAALALGAGLLPVWRAAATLEARGDRTGEPLVPARIRAGQALALAFGLGAALASGMAGLWTLAPLWCAALAVGLSRLAVGTGPVRNT